MLPNQEVNNQSPTKLKVINSNTKTDLMDYDIVQTFESFLFYQLERLKFFYLSFSNFIE